MDQKTLPALPLGTLVALGGGDDDEMLALLRDLLPSPETPVEILTTASLDCAKTAVSYEKALRALGCKVAHHLPIDEHHPADAPEMLARLSRAGMLFFSGGDQERIAEFLHGTEFLRRMREQYQSNPDFIISGTSAGAAAIPDCMLVDGHGWRALRKGGIHTMGGLGLLPELLIDQHFVERGRFGRLAHAVLANPTCLGLGLSEETGIVIRRGHEVEIFGDGVVVVVDGRELQGSNFARVERGEPISAQDLRVHLLVAGQRLDLRTRRVVQ